MSLYEELTFDKFDQELGTAGLAKRTRIGIGGGREWVLSRRHLASGKRSEGAVLLRTPNTNQVQMQMYFEQKQ